MDRKRWTLMACLTAVAIICLTLIAGAQDRGQQFVDVPVDHPFSDAIQQAAEQKWIQGYPDGLYYPSRQITDGQIVRIVRNRFPSGITRAEMADLITDAYPNLDWKLDNHQALGGQPPDWYVQVRVPISPDTDGYIRAKSTGRIGTEWTGVKWIPDDRNYNIHVDRLNQLDSGNVAVIVQYKYSKYDTGPRVQITRQITDNCSAGVSVCWHPEFSICRPDINPAADCWMQEQDWNN